jgi:hypothetical protein
MSSADAPPSVASAALSASTPAFRPSEDNRSSHSLGGTGAGGSSLWGAIGQSYSFASAAARAVRGLRGADAHHRRAVGHGASQCELV